MLHAIERVWWSGNVIRYPAKHLPVSAWCSWPTWNGNSQCMFNIFHSLLFKTGEKDWNFQNSIAILVIYHNSSLGWYSIAMRSKPQKGATVCVFPPLNATQHHHYDTTPSPPPRAVDTPLEKDLLYAKTLRIVLWQSTEYTFSVLRTKSSQNLVLVHRRRYKRC